MKLAVIAAALAAAFTVAVDARAYDRNRVEMEWRALQSQRIEEERLNIERQRLRMEQMEFGRRHCERVRADVSLCARSAEACLKWADMVVECDKRGL